MGKLCIENRQIVVPGEQLATGMDYIPSGGAYRDNEDIYASIVGLAMINGRVVKVIPLRGKYVPKVGDLVIGKIVEHTSSIWFVDVGSYTDGILAVRDVPEYIETGDDLSQYYTYGDYVAAKTSQTTRNGFNLNMKSPGMRKLDNGQIISIDCAKVPRVIGKQGSMITMLKEKTGCRLMVGQNGLIWLNGNDPARERLVVDAIRLIEEKGHQQGLTDIVAEFLEKELAKLGDAPSEEEEPATRKAAKSGSRGRKRSDKE